MGKYMKKLVCGFTILTMAVSMTAVPNLPVNSNVYATEIANANSIVGPCGDNVRYSYNSTNKTLTISGTGAMWDDIEFSDDTLKAQSIVIEEGVTIIGAYSFCNMKNLKNIQIADSVSTIKESAFGKIKGTVEIPATVTKIEGNAITSTGTVIIKGDMTGYEEDSIRANKAKEIVLCGSAKDIAKAIYFNKKTTTITISEENTLCKIENGYLLSADGKELYIYLGDVTKVKIPKSVVKICSRAFWAEEITKVTLGKNVKEIEDEAFRFSDVKKVKFNKSLEKIGKYAFDYTQLSKVELKGKVSIGAKAFGENVVVKNKAGFKKTSTTVSSSYIFVDSLVVDFAKVQGATGYQIKIKAGNKTYKYNTKSNINKMVVDKKLKAYSRKLDKYYEEAYENGTIEGFDKAITVKVRPYKVVKGKKIYGKYSTNAVVDIEY